jgi:AcrR family transcriptional regulator
MDDKLGQRAGYHHGSLPAALVAAALDLLDERGLDKVSVREVARRAGVSPGAPFRHFNDRQALLTAVADRILADFEKWQLAALADAQFGAMRAYGLGFVRYAIRHPHRFELIKSRVFGAEQPDELRSRLDHLEQTLSDIIVAGQQAGELPEGDPAVIGLAGQAIVYGLSQMIIDGYLPRDHADELAERVLDAFGPKPPSSSQIDACWLDGAIVPAVGARFRGYNRNGPRRWATTCSITDAEPGRRFGYEVTAPFNIPLSRWQYDIEPTADGCVVTETSWLRVPSWFIPFGIAITGVANRADTNDANIATTLRRLKAYLEKRSSLRAEGRLTDAGS